MSETETPRPRSVVGPNGMPLSLETLPSPNTRRWVARRKAEVVTAVRSGLLTLEEACARYNLTEEEFGCWERAIDKFGMGGLRVTRIQEFRA
ncbi:MAG: DUF1153 domain-containing protein [Pseudomonadota bacterium]